MIGAYRLSLSILFLFVFSPFLTYVLNVELKNATTIVSFGPDGLLSVEDIQSNALVRVVRDSWLLTIDDAVLR
jgi:hypothetical protein